MSTVREIVNGRDRQLHSISPDTTVQAAIQIMSSELISALPVMESNKLVGIISERDYVRKIAAQKIPAWSVKINEIMTKDVITIDIDTPIEECMKLMTTNRIRHLPVMDNDELKTVISITDVVSVLRLDEN
jgi:CBS domain-containing protein